MTMKMFRTYNKVKDIFAKPILKHKFGLWKHNPCLPVWRRGNIIKIGKYKDIIWVEKIGKPKKYKFRDSYLWSKPTPIKVAEWSDEFKQKHPIISSFVKPRYQLPIWLSFYKFHSDVWVKEKFDDYRYEFPPQLTLVFFGFAMSWWLRAPGYDKCITADDDYWCSIYHYRDMKDLKKVDELMGGWSDDSGYYRCLRDDLLTEKGREQLKRQV